MSETSLERGGRPRTGIATKGFDSSRQVAACFLLTLCVMAWLEFSTPAILDNDGYYHIRWSKLLRESAPHLPQFKWLPLTTLNERSYADQHFLFHVFLIPFTYGDLRLGAKSAAVVFSSVGITSLFALLVAYQVPLRWIWLVLLVGSSEAFLYRMSMTRAPGLTLMLLSLGIYLLLRERFLLLVPLSFAFVWMYNLFPLLVIFACSHLVAVYLTERRFEVRGVLATLSGAIAGLLINPYFPQNFILLWEHLRMTLSASPNAPDVGVEWYPYDSWQMLRDGSVSFAVFFVGLLAFRFRARFRDIKPLLFLMISMVLLLISFRSRRFFEYWPPFAVLFAALSVGPKLGYLSCRRYADRRDRVLAVLVTVFLALALTMGVGFNFWRARSEVREETDPIAWRGASDLLRAHTPPGSRVFNSNWDEFPMLFYYNTSNVYIAGLDPRYLYDRAPGMWKMYERITEGEEKNFAPLIRQHFDAEYVFTDNGSNDFLDAMKASGDFETVYRDKYSLVFRVVPGRIPGSASSTGDSVRNGLEQSGKQ